MSVCVFLCVSMYEKVIKIEDSPQLSTLSN